MAFVIDDIIVAAAVTAMVAGTAAQIYASEEQKKAQKKANKASQGQASIENRRRRVEMIREQQAKAAGIENLQAASEAEGSGFSGSLGAMATNLSAYQGDFSAMERLGAQRASAMNDMGRAQSIASFGAGLQSLGQFGFTNSARLGDLFKPMGTMGTSGGTTAVAPSSGQVRGFQNGMFGGGV